MSECYHHFSSWVYDSGVVDECRIAWSSVVPDEKERILEDLWQRTHSSASDKELPCFELRKMLDERGMTRGDFLALSKAESFAKVPDVLNVYIALYMNEGMFSIATFEVQYNDGKGPSVEEYEF